ncbi:MAG: PrsW family glutamic-type intramembrane protease [Erysipelotrichaceae bacterium]
MNTLLIAALLPGVIFVIYLYRLDKIEKEPISLILKLLLGGLASAALAYLLETVLEMFVCSVFEYASPPYNLVEAFIVAGLSEEFSKFFFLKKFSWNNHNFNFAFDGVLYSAVVSLGFAMSENILYVLTYGFSNAVARALTAIPGHLAFGIIMGIFYSNAKIAQFKGDNRKCRLNLTYALFLATMLHGFYDYCLFDGSDWLIMLWYVTVIIIYVIIFKLVRDYAKNDTELY